MVDNVCNLLGLSNCPIVYENMIMNFGEHENSVIVPIYMMKLFCSYWTH